MSNNSQYYPGDTLYDNFIVKNASNVGAWADSTPTYEFRHNNVVDSSVVATITQGAKTGSYMVSLVIPSGYSPGDTISIIYSPLVSSVEYDVEGFVYKLGNPNPSVGTITTNQLITNA